MSGEADPIAIRVRIHGRVQGVWYRGWTVDLARAHGLSGWVRNRADGTVEALLVGPQREVRAVIEACRDGPRAARVTRIEEVVADHSAEDLAGLDGFQQRPGP